MDDKRMHWAAGAIVVLVALASGCAHRSGAIGEGDTSLRACDRARSVAESYSVRRAGARQATAMDRVAAAAQYDTSLAKQWAVGGFRSRTSDLPRRPRWETGLTFSGNSAAEHCRLAMKREREAELERQQAILTPPR